MNTELFEPKEDTEARAKKTCPCCLEKKDIGLVVCWHCFKNQPKHSNCVMPGYKYWDGTLEEFIIISNIPF